MVLGHIRLAGTGNKHLPERENEFPDQGAERIMTELTKPVSRVSLTRKHEASRMRRFILSLRPPGEVGVRLEGTRQTFRLGAEQVYVLAVRQHSILIEKRARQIAKETGKSIRSARAQACRELKPELKA